MFKRYLIIGLGIVLLFSGVAYARCSQTNCGMLFYDLGTNSGGISKQSGTLLVDKTWELLLHQQIFMFIHLMLIVLNLKPLLIGKFPEQRQVIRIGNL